MDKISNKEINIKDIPKDNLSFIALVDRKRNIKDILKDILSLIVLHEFIEGCKGHSGKAST